MVDQLQGVQKKNTHMEFLENKSIWYWSTLLDHPAPLGPLGTVTVQNGPK